MISINSKHITKSIAVIIMTAMLFSCGNKFEEVNDFLSDKNLPIAVTKNITSVYTDSGYVKNKLDAKLLLNFENRTKHPYQEFPEGIKITTFDKKGDSTTITANYAITYQKTKISEIKGNVVVFNHTQNMTLKTKQLFWDQNLNYFFSNKKATLYKLNDTIIGKDGFDSNADLTNASMMNNKGTFRVKEN